MKAVPFNVHRLGSSVRSKTGSDERARSSLVGSLLNAVVMFFGFLYASDSHALKTLDDVEYDFNLYEYAVPITFSTLNINGEVREFPSATDALNAWMEYMEEAFEKHPYETISFHPIVSGPTENCKSYPAYLNGKTYYRCVRGDVYKNGSYLRTVSNSASESPRCPAPYEVASFPSETTGDGYVNALQACKRFRLFYLLDRSDPPRCSGERDVVGNPIDVLTGTKFQSFVDATMRGVDFVRHYRSSVRAVKAGQGVNWSHSFSSYVNGTEVSGEARLKYSQSQTAFFTGSGKSSARDACALATGRTSLSSTARLRSSTSSVCEEIDNGVVIRSYAVTDSALRPAGDHDVMTIVHDTGELFVFSRLNGQWTEMNRRRASAQGFDSTSGETGIVTYANGVQEVFTEGLLTERKLASGRALTLGYNEKRLLQEVKEGEAVLFSLAHDEEGYLSSVTFGGGTITYGRDGKNNLSAIRHVDGTSEVYHYENPAFPHALTGVTDERGVRYATWQYDSKGRAISSEHGNDQERVTLDYSRIDDSAAPRIITTNPLGKTTVYHLQSVAGSRKIVRVEGHASANCAASSRDYDYFPDGSLRSRTDWNGNTTIYERDALGREISRTEAFGTSAARTTLTEYHPVHDLPAKIIEDDRTTLFEYDMAGRLTSKKMQPSAAQ